MKSENKKMLVEKIKGHSFGNRRDERVIVRVKLMRVI
jgi:hypothetical protein